MPATARPSPVQAEKLRLAIVGGGPMCTYALERLAARLAGVDLERHLSISIFERTGRFGAGAIHSDKQVRTSYMNRVASQITFAADDTNRDAVQLLPEHQRPSFLQWCARSYRETRDPQYRVGPGDVPRRYLHGLALKEAFSRYRDILCGIRGVTVSLYETEVIDVCSTDGAAPYRLCTSGAGDALTLLADRVLFVTGVSRNRGRAAVYPLDRHLTPQTVPARSSVAVLGLGLTAVDIFLHLTEGRGGTFSPAAQDATKLNYHRSGNEPATIIGLSQSGMLKTCRPNNAKAADPTARSHSALEHKPAFFTPTALRTVQHTFGAPTELRDGCTVRQVDFELHLFPLLVLEMAFVYYKTLLGDPFGDEVKRAARIRYHEFLNSCSSSRDTSIERLLEPVQRLFDEAATYICATASGMSTVDTSRRFDAMHVAESFHMTVFGTPQPGASSPWGHSTDVHDHRFNWRRLFRPVTPDDITDETNWQDLVATFMHHDHLGAAQGNLRNPVKAACDGVWRDLRSLLASVIDRGGLNPTSHKQFIDVYLRYYERMSNGTGLEPMSKVLALIEAGLLDVSVGPEPTVERFGSAACIRGSVTGVVRYADTVVNGRIDQFDATADSAPLYPSLLRRGLIRRWSNSTNEASFTPGALDLDTSFHPVTANGTTNSDFTFLGAPTEGLCFFQLSAGRPRSDSYVLNSVARWANELIDSLRDAPSVVGPR